MRLQGLRSTFKIFLELFLLRYDYSIHYKRIRHALTFFLNHEHMNAYKKSMESMPGSYAIRATIKSRPWI
jgi:hypothetical protein